MLEQVFRFVAKVDEKTSHWIVENGTTLDVAEKMLIQFLSQISQIRVQQSQQNQPPVPQLQEEPKVEEPQEPKQE